MVHDYDVLVLCGMFFKSDATTLMVTAGPDAPIHAITLTGFAFVSAELWCANNADVLVCATPHGARLPRLGASVNDKGDRRLFRWRPADTTEWQEIYRGYAGDVTCLAPDVYAVHQGAGLTFLHTSGAVIREHKVGRFSWGAPSLSTSPSGSLVALVRWQGDNQKLHVDNVDGSVSRTFHPSIFRYAWIDNRSILYIYGRELRVLDIESGRFRRFGKGVRELMASALGLPKSADVATNVGELSVVADRVWFSGTLTDLRSKEWVAGIFSADLHGHAARSELLASGNAGPEGLYELVEDFAVTDDLSIVASFGGYEKGRQCSQQVRTHGALAQFLSEGWWPLRTRHEPDFGHRTLQFLVK